MAEPYLHQPYPAWRYHPTHPARVVQSVVEDAALGAGWQPLPLAAPVATPVAVATAVETVRVGATPANLSAAQVAEAREQRATEMHKTPVATLLEAIAQIPTLDVVATAREAEQTHPKGPRKSVLEALDARAKTLTPPIA